MHLALYLLMIGMPLAGWLILSAADNRCRSSAWSCRT